jgi:hypothetical protein
MRTLLYLTAATAALTLASCYDEHYVEGRITTAAAADVTPQSAVLNGSVEIAASGGAKPEVADRGFVFGAKPDALNRTVRSSAGGTGSFVCTAEGLMPNTKYYARAYAALGRADSASSAQTVFGNTVEFTTPNGQAAPYVSTQEVSGVAYGTATLNGEVISTGLPVAAEYGFAYGKAPKPTVDGMKKTASGSSAVGAYSLTATDLEADVTYYARAYAANAKGTAYGEEVSFKFTSVKPALTTKAVSSINVSGGTATFNGSITNAGNPAYTERGFVYGTARNPTLQNTRKPASGSGAAGDYSLVVTEIPVTSTNLTYYVRAYAISLIDTVYGGEINFNFSGSLPSFNVSGSVSALTVDLAAGTARFSTSGLSSVGVPPYTEKGFRYYTSTMDSIVVVPGSGTAGFSVDVTGIPLGRTYTVRAYAKNEFGVAYSHDYATLNFNVTAPTFGTNVSATYDFAAGTATFTAYINGSGNPYYTEKGFVFGTTTNPDITSGTKVTATETGILSGSFSATASSGLVQGQTYHVRAYATTSVDTYYSTSSATFDFNPVAPVFGASSVSNKDITAGTAVFNGSISSAGNPAYTERGFVYDLASNPTPTVTNGAPKATVSGTGTGNFSSATLSGFTQGQTYTMRAYATTSIDTYYSNNVTVSFVPTPPSVTTGAVTVLSTTSARFNGTITSSGNPTFTEKGFVYALSTTSTNPTTAHTKVVVSTTGTTAYYADVTGLTSGRTYYVRAYITSSLGTEYGTPVSFTAAAPDYVVLTQANLAVQKTDISASTTALSAINLCTASRTAGYSDWRVPTIAELSVLYTNRTTIGGFTTSGYYTSSSSSGGGDHYYLYFSNGSQIDGYSLSPKNTGRVRCVRDL